MSSQNISRTFKCNAGATMAIKTNTAVFPMGIGVRLGAGASATKTNSAANRPGGKFIAPATQSDLNADALIAETVPVAWLLIEATNGPVEVDLCGPGLSGVEVHNSDTDPMPANSQEDIAVPNGHTESYPISRYINYPKGSLTATVASADETKLTGTFNEETGDIELTGVMPEPAGVNVTVTATAPTGEQTTLTLRCQVL